MTYSYTFKDLSNYSMNSSNDIFLNTTNVIRSLRISLRRAKRNDLIRILNDIHILRKCSFCNDSLEPDKFAFAPSINDNIVTLKSAGHTKDKDWGLYYKCLRKSCPGNKLNPNSVEFISKSYKLSTDEAKSVIHSRNSSPFYRCNHNSLNDYKNFQSLKSRLGDERFQKILCQQEHTRQQHKHNYIAEYGQVAWDDLMKSQRDTSSLEYFKSIYESEKEAISAFNKKNSKTSHFAPIPSEYHKFDYWWNKHYSTIVTKNDFYNHLISKLDGYGQIGKCLMISRWQNNYPCLYIGVHRFSINNIYKFLNINESVYKIRHNFHTGMYAYQSTVDGLFFRSSAELDLYIMFKKYGVEVLDTNKQYPNSNWHYDFKIRYQDNIYYIELCSDIDEMYITKMLNKQKEMDNCILVSNRLTSSFVDAIIAGNDIEKGNFHGRN